MDWWFDLSECVDELSLTLFEMKKLRLGCSSDVSFVREAEMQSAGSI